MKKDNGNKASSKTLSRLYKSLSVSYKGVGLEIMEKELYDAYHAYKRIKYEALKYQKIFLWDKSLALEAEGGIKASKHIKQLLWIEDQRKQARAINDSISVQNKK